MGALCRRATTATRAVVLLLCVSVAGAFPPGGLFSGAAARTPRGQLGGPLQRTQLKGHIVNFADEAELLAGVDAIGSAAAPIHGRRSAFRGDEVHQLGDAGGHVVGSGSQRGCRCIDIAVALHHCVLEGDAYRRSRAPFRASLMHFLVHGIRFRKGVHCAGR